MSAVAAVNVGLFYLVKCGRHGAEVRGGLTRAFLAAERVRRVAEAPAEASTRPVRRRRRRTRTTPWRSAQEERGNDES